jgi:hypothetical protein
MPRGVKNMGREDPLLSLVQLSAEVERISEEMRSNPDPAALVRLAELMKELERLRALSRDRAVEGLEIVREGFMEAIAPGLSKRAREEQATLTVKLSEPISPGAFAEILTAFDTLHKELAGTPLRGLVAKIGLPEEVVAHSGPAWPIAGSLSRGARSCSTESFK